MKFKFVVKFGVNGRTKGDIEALADARRALKNWFNTLKKFLIIFLRHAVHYLVKHTT